MPKKADVIEPIDASLEQVTDKIFGIKDMPQEEIDKLPFAKWRGKLDLGGHELDVYVLNDETRVLSSGSTTEVLPDPWTGSGGF